MAKVEKSIKVEVPVETAYNQWTQFETFPRFMDGVKEVRQIDDARLFWAAEIGGERREWYAKITRQEPDKVIAWQSEAGPENAGIVSFRPADQGATEVSLALDYEPDGLKEQVGDALGVVSRRVEGNLQRFKEFIEQRGEETGAWRGSIDASETTTGRYGASGQGGSGHGGTPPEGGRPAN